MFQLFGRLLSVFFVLSLLPLCVISPNSLSSRFRADEIRHLLDLAFNEEIDFLIANSCSVSKVIFSRKFVNHVRISNLSYGAVIIEGIISHDPFDLPIIENFYDRCPNPCLLDAYETRMMNLKEEKVTLMLMMR
jgi:hypothetical protein